MASQMGTFPVLDPQSLLADLVTAECPVTPDDLAHPTPARAQAIYEWWMNRMLGIKAEDVRRAADAQLADMEHPDIYRDAMYIGVFAYTLTQLLERCAVADFTIKDLTAPTAKRFREVLSGIVNFFFFEQEQGANVLQPLEDEVEHLANEEDQLGNEVAELKERIAQEREQRAANEREMKRNQDADEQAVRELNAKRTEANAIKEQGEKSKSELAALRQRKLELSQDINRLDITISELKGQIVSSPDKLQASINELQAQLRREQETFHKHEAKERQTTNKINQLSQYSVELHSCIRVLDDWQADVDRLHEAEQQLSGHASDLAQMQEEQKELQERIALLQRRITNGRDELLRMKDKMDRRRDTHKQRKRALEEAHAKHLETKRQLEMEAAEKNRQAAEVEQQIRTMHASLQAELEKGEKAYKRIKDQVSLYSIRINKALDSLNELSSQTPEI
ncbi:hypothetical protein JCM11641_000563 [Rhodosporidiobolus odoratus]